MRRSAMHRRLRLLTGLAALLATVIASCHDGRADNLLANPFLREGVFEPTSWSLNEPEANRVTWLQSGKTDDFALQLDAGGKDWAGATSGSVPVSPRETLTVAAWVKTDDRVGEGAHLYVRFFGGGRFLGQTGPLLPAHIREWRLVQGRVTAPEGATAADVSLQVWSASTVWLHSAALLRGTDAAEPGRVLPPPGSDAFELVKLPRGKPEDANRNGLPDTLEAALGITPADKARSTRLTRRRTASLQTPTGYREDNDLKVDRIIVAGNQESSIRSWQSFGYVADVMGGFRAGPEYVQAHPDEPQTDAAGTPLTCGPGSYYMVPTANRRRIMADYFAAGVRNGAEAVCPEEPEFFNRAGYSEAFKREWQAAYGEPWQDPASSVDARLKAERLKARLEHQLLAGIYQAARQANPKAARFLLAHSPLNYTAWGITFAHADMVKSGLVDEMVAQVWTGTARSQVTYRGQSAERTFENAFLEYSSSHNLVRGLDIPVWFLMDPLEDNPDRAMEDYHTNYERTLAASLLFPEVDRFETMPWPTRIFGRVPAGFATEIASVINVLSDMQNQASPRSPLPVGEGPRVRVQWDCGTQGIATFIADSAMFQRGEPSASDMDDFYGLCLPLLMRGIPVQIAHLDRLDTPGYLAPYHTLLVSYDALKPESRLANEKLAAWVRAGGSLLVCGGEDAYNEADEWWKKAGFHGPTDHLLSLLGLQVKGRRLAGGPSGQERWQVVARTDYTGRNLENRKVEEIDLSSFLAESDAVYIKFEDTLKDDGWGAFITSIELEGTRDGKPLDDTFTPGTEGERAYIHHDDRTNLTAAQPQARFCDGRTSIVYRFPFDRGSRATMRVDVGNQYEVSASTAAPDVTRRFEAPRWPGSADLWQIPVGQAFVTHDGTGAEPLVASGADALVLEQQVGKGHAFFCGLPGRHFAGSELGDRQLRALVARLTAAAGRQYVEKPYLKLRRGDYVIAKTFDRELRIEGHYVDPLRPDLPVLDDVHLAPDSLAVLRDVSGLMQPGKPRVLFCSSCVEWKSEEPTRTRLIVSGALGVRGACRLWTGGRKMATLRGTSASGGEVKIDVRTEGDTLLLTYDNLPNGIAIDLRWG